jgi:hypothetical protein
MEDTFGCDLTQDDMVYNIQDGVIQSAGYNINSLFLKHNKSPMITKNKETNNILESLLKNSAIPTGLLYMNQALGKNYTSINHDNVIDDNLYDKLTHMASNESMNKNKTETPNVSKKPTKKPRNTRKQKKGDAKSRRTKKKS